MKTKLKNIIYDLQHNMFGGNTLLSLSFNDNVKLYYPSEFKKIPNYLLGKQIKRKTLIGNIYYITI